jgi:SAM-dependent methyltransferase
MLTHYDNKQAREYDTRSEFDKGDRQRQGHYLLEAVGFSGRPVHRFIELGCGTGYFSELVLKAFPSAQALLIDDSEAMLTAPGRFFQPGDVPVPAYRERPERGRLGVSRSGFVRHDPAPADTRRAPALPRVGL